VRHQGEALGELTLKKRPGEPVTPVERQLIDDLAAQAGQLLRNVRLTSELRARVEEVSRQSEELRASRERIVAEQDRERRRLERDIHDGAQQHLVALAVKLRLAASLAKRDAQKARRSIGELESQTAEAVGTLRDLAQGIYPPILRQRGLVEALRQHSAVTATEVKRYEPELEAAVYFSCLEALQNAAKHAQATMTTIELVEGDGELRFEVRDNGAGFETERIKPGSGLQNMEDRIRSLGGVLTIQSNPSQGTTVAGVIPLHQRAGIAR
jgi:signal transduction histidine kinase